jgi:hypothetical protein
MIPMVERFLRQKFDGPLVLGTLAVLAFLVALPPTLASGPARLIALLLIAGGAVSRDASSGALQMILSRPVTRTGYLAGRLLGVLSAYGVFLAAAAVLAILVSVKVGGTAALLPALPRAFAGALLDGLQVAALLLFFSTFLPAYGDVLGYVFLWITLTAGESFLVALGRDGASKVARAAHENLLPEVRWEAVFGPGKVPVEALGRWVLAVVICFVLAAAILARREFAYGQD